MSVQLGQRSRLTPHLELRPFRRRDVAAVDEAVLASLPELARWLPWANVHYTKAVSQQFVRDSIAAWAEGRAYDFAIRRPDVPNRHLGNVSVWYTSKPNRVGEIGYWVRSDEAGRGICTEATAHVLAVAFEELRLHRVTMRIAVGNRASERVAEKLGFLLEGTLRGEVKIGDRWLDHTVWGLLDNEWRVERRRYQAMAWV
ncbi:MAG: GNAT family protein [Acidimicrobiia bacterium]|jgi:ribosomal-protein-serine acetyltransferase